MGAAWTQATKDLGRGVDPRAWAASHPWIALATAAAGGFVAATQIVPSRDEQMLKKLEKIQEALTGQSKRERAKEAADVEEQLDPAAKPQKKNRGFLSVIGTEVIKYLGPALSSALSAAVAGKSVSNAAEDAHDGNPAPQTDPNADPAATI